MTRIHNFAAGPGTLPLEVLEQAAADFVDYKGEGLSLIEMSHRSAIFGEIIEKARNGIRELLNVPDSHEILFLQGGGHTQFAMVPLNLLGAAAAATYVVNGVWSKKAAIEASKFCHVETIGKNDGISVPDFNEIAVELDTAYLYYCQNETVNGLEFNFVPDCPKGVPLVSDVSSNFLSRPIDFERHALVFAGAQKNFGPAGLTVVILRKDLLGLTGESCPTMLNYEVHANAKSLYNTPPTFAIWIASLVTDWIRKEGGVAEMDRRARERALCLYGAIDASEGFYINRIEGSARSRMNVVFNLREEALTELFIKEAASHGLKNIKGHRLLGGLRASLYNAMPIEGAQELTEFMNDFANRHG